MANLFFALRTNVTGDLFMAHVWNPWNENGLDGLRRTVLVGFRWLSSVLSELLNILSGLESLW